MMMRVGPRRRVHSWSSGGGGRGGEGQITENMIFNLLELAKLSGAGLHDRWLSHRRRKTWFTGGGFATSQGYITEAAIRKLDIE